MTESDDGFPKQGGTEALEIGDDFDSEEEPDDQESDTQNRQNMQIPDSKPKATEAAAGAKPPDVKGQKVDNQPFDLAVDVNDSEEIDSDEEEDEVNVEVNTVQNQAAAKAQQ